MEELLLVKLQVSACNFTKSNTRPWVFLKFFLNCANGTKSCKASHIYWLNLSFIGFNPFEPSVAFHIETSHLFCNTGLKWVKICLKYYSFGPFLGKNGYIYFEWLVSFVVRICFFLWRSLSVELILLIHCFV